MATDTFTPITLSTSYQTGYDYTVNRPARVVLVSPKGIDVTVKTTLQTGDVLIVTVSDGDTYPATGVLNTATPFVNKIEVKAASATGTCNFAPSVY